MLAAVAAAPSAMAAAPVFSDTTLTREIAENSAADTNVGNPIPAATDGDGQTLAYTMGGTDADSFTFEDTTRQIKTKDALDFETKSSYSVTITATDTDDETDTVDVTITVTDELDDPTVSIGEGSAEEGNDVTFEVTFSEPATKAATVSWTASTSAGTASSNDLSGATSGRLTFAVGDRSKTVTISTVDDEVYEADETFTVRLTNATGAVLGTARDASGTINNDEAVPTVTLSLDSATIREASNGGGNEHQTVLTPTLDIAVEAELRISITTDPTDLVHGPGQALSQTKIYTMAAGQLTSTTGTVEAVHNDIDEPDRTATITINVIWINSGPLEGAVIHRGPDQTVTITDDDDAPTVTLSVQPSSISESDGGGTDHISTVTATQSHGSSEATTLTVSAAGISPTTTGDFTLSSNRVLTIPARTTASTGAVTVTAQDNTTHAANNRLTVSATATNTQGIGGNPSDVGIEIRDDEGPPRVVLVLGGSSISEASGTTTVKATIPHRSSHETIVTVTPVAGAFTVSGALTIAAGGTESATATLTAIDNETDAADRRVGVRATATNGYGIENPVEVHLTITDDDATPVVTLVLSPASIGENGSTSTVTATLDRPSENETTVTVQVDAVSPGRDDDFNVSTNKVLTVAAGAKISTGTVTIRARNNETDAPDKTVTVSAMVSNTIGATAPAAQTLTITDDDASPRVTLALSRTTTSEDDGTAIGVTASLSRPSSRETTVTISAAGVGAATAADFTLSVNRDVTITAGQTTSTGTVTLRAVDNETDAPDKTVTVSATVDNLQGYETGTPADLTLTIEDDDATPVATLVLTPGTIEENGGSTAITAVLNHPSSETTTIEVSSAPVNPAVTGDYTISTNKTLTIAPGATDSTGNVTITALDNDVDAPHKEVRVSARASNSQRVQGQGGASGTTNVALSNVALSITDDEESPVLSLVLGRAVIDESGTNSTTLAAALSHPSSEATRITILAVPGDFTLSTSVLNIPAGDVDSDASITLTAVDDNTDAPDKVLEVVAESVTNSQGYSGPSPQRLEIHDDEASPTVTLHLDASISENNGTSKVTAQLSHPSSEATTVTVDATAVHPTLDADFTITGTVLEITAGATRSTGTGATITAIDNITDAPDKEVTVSANVVNTQGFENGTPADKTLTVVDDEAPPGVTLWLSKSAIAEATGQASVTATLTHPSSEATLVTITATPISPAVAADFNQNGTQVTIPAGLTASTGTVSVTAIDNDIDAADKRITISGAASNAKVPPPGVASNPTSVSLTIEDDDVRGITFDPATQVMVEGLANNPNDAEYDVALTTEPTGTVTVTVTGTNALKIATASNPGSSDFGTSKTLSFNPSNWDTGQTVTLRASADGNTSNNTVRVGHRASGSDYGSVSENFSVSVLDANRRPVTLELSVDRRTVGEEDGTVLLNVTAALGGTGTTTEPEEYLVVISAAAGTASNDDFTANSSTFRIGGNYDYQGTFRTTNQIGLTVVNDGIDENDESVTITATAAPQNNGQPAATIVGTSVTIEDDDTRGVTIAPAQIELDEGGSRGYTVKLDSQPTATVTVTPAKSGDADISIRPSMLTFTDMTWDTAQTVTVEAAEDNDPLDDQATIRHAVAGGDYGTNNVRAITVQATARDNDGRGVNVSTRDLTVAEGATETYTVWLNSQPTGTVRISPRVSGDGDVTARPRELSFTAATWETPQTVTVEAATDPDIDDDRASITHGVSGADYGASNVPGPEILVRATDSGATTSTGTMTVSHGTVREGSSTRAFMITATLDGTRAMQTVVTVVVRGGTASANDFEATPSAFRLRIGSGQTSARQSIRLDATGDSTAETDETIIVEGTAPGLTFRSAETTIIDDDQAGIVISRTTITVREQEQGQSYTVKLRSAPDSTVTVTATVEGENEVTATPSQLTFTATNWNRAQTITVRAGADPDGDHEEAKITHQAKGGDYEGRRGETVTVTVNDDDEGSRRVALSLSVERIGEGAGAQTLSLTATLDGAQRSIDTAVNVTVGGGTAQETTDYTADSGFTITIPKGSTSATGTFNFTPVDDGIDEGDETVNVSATATGLSVTATTIVIVDNDDRGVTASLAVMTVNEGGTNTYTVVLDTQPTGEVTVRPSVAGDSDVTVRPGSVSFSTRNWRTAQTFSVSAAHDENAADDSATISHRASGADYAQVRIEDVTVTVRDEDTRGVTISTETLELREGGENSYTIVLDTRPTGTVTIRPTLSGDSDGDVRARPSTLRFTTSSWNTAQTVTVSANQDGDSAADSATINHVVAGADYDGTTAAQVTVRVSDDDVPSTAIVLKVSHDSVAEGTPRQVTVTAELNASPASTDTVVTLTLEADSAQAEDFNAIAPVELVIIAGRTSATAQVRIAPIDDAIDEVAEETLRIATTTTSGLALSPSTAFTIRIEDDDEAGITLSRSALTVREEGSASYTIRLNSQPTQNIEIDIGTEGTTARR